MGLGPDSEFRVVWIRNRESALVFLDPGRYDKVILNLVENNDQQVW